VCAIFDEVTPIHIELLARFPIEQDWTVVSLMVPKTAVVGSERQGCRDRKRGRTKRSSKSFTEAPWGKATRGHETLRTSNEVAAVGIADAVKEENRFRGGKHLQSGWGLSHDLKKAATVFGEGGKDSDIVKRSRGEHQLRPSPET